MKSLDKKDMPKLVGLILFALSLFGFAAFQYMSSGDRPPPQVAAKADDKSGPAHAAAGAGVANVPVFDVASLGPPVGGKDPFVPNGTAAPIDKPLVAAAPPPAAALAKPEIAEIKAGGSDPLPAMMTKPIFGAAGAGFDGTTAARTAPVAAPATAVVLPPPPPPAYTVTGIVQGDRSAGHGTNVAVLRGENGAAGSERRFVTVGDPVGNGFIVDAVLPDGIEIKSGNRRVTLKLGSGSGTKTRAN